jgi:protease IV
MNNQRRFLLIAVICAPVVIGLAYLALQSNSESPSLPQMKRIGLVRIFDVIYSSEQYIDQLRELRKDNSVAGVLLRIDSPGGAVAPSQEIYKEILRYREDNKPLVVSMGNVAASGGYYIASPAMRIFANPGTITGSIGVIFRFPEYYKLMDKIGLKMETVKSGEFKDIGNPHREMSPKERVLVQSLIDDTYEQFLDDVCIGRRMSKDTLRPLADGRIFTGRQAVLHKLIDTLGTYEDALAFLRSHVGLGERSKVFERKPKKSLINDLLSEDLFDKIPLLGGLHRPAGAYFLFGVN